MPILRRVPRRLHVTDAPSPAAGARPSLRAQLDAVYQRLDDDD